MARHRRPRRPRRRKRLTRHQRLVRYFDRSPLYNPEQQLSGYNLRRAAGQLTDFQFKPQETELSNQLGSIGRQGGALIGRASSYYKQLAAQEGQNLARQAALSKQTNTDLANIGNQTQAQIGQAEQSAAAAQGQDAALRGQGLQGGDRPAIDLAAQHGAAASGSQAFRQAGVLQGANYQSLGAASRTARQQRGGEVVGGLTTRVANAQNDVRKQLAALAAQRGPAMSKNVLDLRQSAFENIATQQGLGLKGAQIAATAANQRGERSLARARIHESGRHNRATERIAQINAELAAGNLSERQKHDRITERQGWQRLLKGSGKGGGVSHSDRKQAVGWLSKAMGVARSSKKFRRNPRRYGHSMVNLLMSRGIPDWIALMAVRQAAHGGVTGADWKRARRYGLHRHGVRRLGAPGSFHRNLFGG